MSLLEWNEWMKNDDTLFFFWRLNNMLLFLRSGMVPLSGLY